MQRGSCVTTVSLLAHTSDSLAMDRDLLHPEDSWLIVNGTVFQRLMSASIVHTMMYHGGQLVRESEVLRPP